MKRRIVSHQVNPADVNKQQFSTDQASVLDELSYLLSTEYEAVKWYDKAIPEIKASGLDPELVAELVQGIKEIRKDEEDHIAHIERLTNLVKGVTEVEASTKSVKNPKAVIKAASAGRNNWMNICRSKGISFKELMDTYTTETGKDIRRPESGAYSDDFVDWVWNNYCQDDKIEADTVKKKNGKWTNRGDTGEEHGEFDTKKEADAQRRAMYATGYKG